MKKLLCLTLLAALPCAAQESAPAQAPAPADEAFYSHLNFNPRNSTEQLALVIQEIYKLKTELLVSNFRQEYSEQIRLHRLQYPANTRGHEAIPAYLFTPAHLSEGKKYPAILMLHGGDHPQLSADWFPWIAAAVERGYVVMFPEYRGSSGFGELIYENDYGTTDFADVLAAGSYLAGCDFVDPARMAVVGHSRGGMLALRAIETEPHRYAAAADLAALTDMVAFMAYKEQARREDIASQKGFGGKLPDKNLFAYEAISPALAVDKIQIPLLVLSTTHDTNVPYELNNKRVVEALTAYGKTFENHVYENAPGSHMFFFVDCPEGRDSLRRTYDFLAKYLHPDARK